MIQRNIAVIGLGYVGLPVAVAFSQKGLTIGFDINEIRLEELKNGFDRTKEITRAELSQGSLVFSSSLEELEKADFFIVTVPTPIDHVNQPDLTPLKKASETIGKVLKKGDIVVYESTVYPGATEEICVPLLERFSGLKLGQDFSVGYSPERINPSDKKHIFTKINKVVSASDSSSLHIIANVYEQVIEAQVFQAKSIKVAEAAKVIENTQRDLNIALINELSILFNRLDIDTLDVLEAAGTKWNFLPFRPGLVGGHCIGVDPYYLTHKAEEVGYHPEVILAGRRINNAMGSFIGQQVIKKLMAHGVNPIDATITIMGMTFKENCTDIRNTKVIDIINELKSFNINFKVVDPYALSEEVFHEYGISLTSMSDLTPADAIIFAVAHDEFKAFPASIFNTLLKPSGLIGDIKGFLDREFIHQMGFKLWRL